MPGSQYKVVVVDAKFPSYEIERSILAEIGASLEVHRCTSPEEAISVSRDAHALLVTALQIDSHFIDQLENCKGIVRYGVGYDVIDIRAAGARGIPVANIPDYCTAEVADHALALILSTLRKLPQITARVKAGEWTGSPCRPIRSLGSQTLGLLGLGRIGREVARRAAPFGFELITHDPYVSKEELAALGIEQASFEEILARSDVLSLHLPLNADTHHLINADALSRMKKGAVLINVSRGGLIDEAALVAAIKAGHTGGAALDVLENEPISPSHELLKLESVTITSHCAWYAEEAMDRLHEYAANEIVRFLQGMPARNVVNKSLLASAPKQEQRVKE